MCPPKNISRARLFTYHCHAKAADKLEFPALCSNFYACTREGSLSNGSPGLPPLGVSGSGSGVGIRSFCALA